VLIRPALPSDYDSALRVIGDAFGIVAREPSVHTTVADAPSGHLLVAERDGVIVGTGGSVGFGPTGWIGGIAVAPEARGNGLGRALTEAAIEALGPRETLLLLASAAGRPIYDRLGFEGEFSYRSFWTPPDAAPVPGDTRPLTLEDRDAVLALDARVTGEQRTLAVDVGLIGGLAMPDLSAVALRPPWPARPILARDPAAGAALLAAVLEPGMRLAVPDANAPALEALLALGCAEGPSVLRMRRGAPVAWRPDELWGVFSLFFG
jgi:GNAT superfamily N-acetyltransferase